MNKAELVKEVERLSTQLEIEQSRPTGTTISDCTVSMDKDEEVIAVARAVEEGMKALTSVNTRPSYGIYIGGS